MSFKRILIIPAIFLCTACPQKNNPEAESLADPDGLSVVQTSSTEATLSWNDICNGESGYSVFVHKEGEGAFTKPFATLPADSRSMDFDSLEPGETYEFGVRAWNDRGMSRLVCSDPFYMVPPEEPEGPDEPEENDPNAPVFTFNSIESSSAWIAVDYTITKLSAISFERGVCMSAEHKPTVSDIVFPGPQGKRGIQVLTAAALEHNVEYQLRAYVKTGDKCYYSEVQNVSLASEPASIELNWTEVSGLGLPSSVKVYKTTDQLNGRAFNAWYAIASCTSDVELRVVYSGDGVTKTIDTMASENDGCLVMINGGIFSTKYKLPIGFALCDGTQTVWRVVEDDGQRVDREYWSADGKLHPVSRGMFGVDSDGHPGVYWSFTPEYGNVAVYDRPIPSMAGGPVYPEADENFPCAPASWVPYNAITCGPVLLKDGHCPIDAGKTSDGTWYSNYELWANDIFGVNQHPDRTAVGYLADGRVILFVCDGRISQSDGATTLEVAAIMKGLGCVGALNLDGGGSTGMWAGGQHLNSLLTGSTDPQKPNETYNRPVMTGVGFFSR